MENTQTPQAGAAGGDSPEVSRRGAMAAGGLALAALVAGGCGWLAMNAGTRGEPSLSAKVVDSPGTGRFPGSTYAASEQQAMYAAGIPADIAYAHLTPGKQAAALVEQKESYIEFSFDSLTPGIPYMLSCDVYLDDWAYPAPGDEEAAGPFERDESGRAGFVADRSHLTRTGLVIVPDKASGTVRSAFLRPAQLADNQQLATRCAWQRLDVH